MAEADVAARTAWTGLAKPGRFGTPGGEPGVVVAGLPSGPMALLSASHAGARDLVRAALALGIDLPTKPAWVRQGTRTVLWAGPDQWWIRGEAPFAALAAELAALGPSIGLSDVGDARAILSVRGPRARATLAKGFEIDLHPRAFGTGDLALTTAAGIPAALWQTDDAPGYAIAVPRSYAGSFWHWLAGSAAEYGFRVEAG